MHVKNEPRVKRYPRVISLATPLQFPYPIPTCGSQFYLPLPSQIFCTPVPTAHFSIVPRVPP
jgi:hypothetical protein